MNKKQNMTNSEHFEHFRMVSDAMDEQKASCNERKTYYLGLIARYLAVIADVLEERKVGDTDGKS